MRKAVCFLWLIIIGCSTCLFVGCLDQRREQNYADRLNNPIVNSSFAGWHIEEITENVSVKLPDGWYFNSNDFCLYNGEGTKMAFGIVSKNTISYDDYCLILSDYLNAHIIDYSLELLTQHGFHDEAKAYQLTCHTDDGQTVIIMQTGFVSYEDSVDKCWFVFTDISSMDLYEIITAITWSWQIRE